MSKKIFIIITIICCLCILAGGIIYFSPEARLMRHISRGEDYLNRGKLILAAEEAQKAMEINQKNYAPYLLFGKIYITQKQYGLAIDKLSNAEELCPDSIEIYYYTSMAYRGKGEFNKALAKLDKAIALEERAEDNSWGEKLKETKFDTYIEYGKLLQSRGKLKEGKEKFVKAMYIEPKNPYPHYYLTGLYIDMDRLDLALEEARCTMNLKTTLGADAFYKLARACKNKALGKEGLALYRSFTDKLGDMMGKESNLIVREILRQVRNYSENELKKLEKENR
jgi:tetratricopeptide (TPR) repeat protein